MFVFINQSLLIPLKLTVQSNKKYGDFAPYILVDNALKFCSADLTESYITGCFEEDPTPTDVEL